MERATPKSRSVCRLARAALFLCLFLSPLSSAQAHPVPRRTHDRTVAVKLALDPQSEQIIVTVAYRLEVDEQTVVFDDLPALADKVELTKFRTPDEFYEAFTAAYAPILGANLLAGLDAQPLAFRCIQRGHSVKDEHGVPLNHLRCDFVFQARVSLADSDRLPRHEFTFREANYELEEGTIRLSMSADKPVSFETTSQPEAALLALPATELKPGDDARLRNLRATFSLTQGVTATSQSAETVPTPGSAAQKSWWRLLRELSLRDLFRETKYGFWMLLFLALGVGGIHALTPGHGKTLVAAYLVGERGTIGHAFVLGLVTTLTHTGVVIAIAVALRFFVPGGRLTVAGQQQLQIALELGGGMLVVGLGFWLLLRRLAGQADHFHLPGHGHHHHDHDHEHAQHDHSHADHYHDEHGHTHRLPDARQVSWWGLIVLGINGGIVPCWDAIVVLLLAVSTNRLWLALPMLLAFSAGLASVLILVGVVVVRAKHLAGPRFQKSKASRLLPIFSAAVVTLLGLWLCYDSLHVKPAPPADVMRQQQW